MKGIDWNLKNDIGGKSFQIKKDFMLVCMRSCSEFKTNILRINQWIFQAQSKTTFSLICTSNKQMKHLKFPQEFFG